ncbi:hypothetical protein ACPCBC_20895 [Streptomyces incarnatus]|uniref:hypothetical protein n=1 Tax=unclassified Streptomyces TaxID=2593676 RepID=UPI0011A1125A|nr:MULTISPECIES: hypothetical protein [Streptomyces]QHC32847.1 hypothetical protein GR129_32790 [Streptomyces sp. HF10]WKE73325.1 hypothetical protein QHG49_32110 [Streptomyces sp. WP-1]
MIAQPTEQPDIPQAETGWAQAHSRRDRPDLRVRTCVPAVLDRTGTARPGNGPEDTIVRGED